MPVGVTLLVVPALAQALLRPASVHSLALPALVMLEETQSGRVTRAVAAVAAAAAVAAGVVALLVAVVAQVALRLRLILTLTSRPTG
jgi:hypothetical protein